MKMDKAILKKMIAGDIYNLLKNENESSFAYFCKKSYYKIRYCKKLAQFINIVAFVLIISALIFTMVFVAKKSMTRCMNQGGTFRGCANI